MDKRDFEFDLFDPQQTQNMWDKMQRMRSECPVAQPADGFYYTSRYLDTQRVFRDSRTFSCEGGFRAAGVVIPEDELFLAEMDAPLHPRLRKLLLKSFNPGMAKGAETFTQSYINQLLDDLKGKGGGDIVGEFSRVPLAVTGHVLGIPLADIAELSAQFFELLHTDWPAYGVQGPRAPRRRQGHRRLGARARRLPRPHDRRAPAPGEVKPDDLLSQMVDADIDGERCRPSASGRWPSTSCRPACRHQPHQQPRTTDLIATDDFARTLRAEPELIPVAVDESLRFEPPVLFLFRTAKQDTEIADTAVKAGDRLVTGIASANRDESVFPDADEFRLDRDPTPSTSRSVPGRTCAWAITSPASRAGWRSRSSSAHFAPGELGSRPASSYHLMPHFLEYGPEHLDVVVQAGAK